MVTPELEHVGHWRAHRDPMVYMLGTLLVLLILWLVKGPT